MSCSRDPPCAGWRERPARALAFALIASSFHIAATQTAGYSAGAIAVAVIAVVVVLLVVAWAVMSRRAFEPRWLLSLRHSIAEAGLHASETWAEFADWMRLGR
jgi:hypothetical protein